MPLQMRDETAGINIVYIDNGGNLGLGSFPNSGQALTVQGTSFVSTSGQFGSGVMQPGSQAGYEGQVYVPGSSTASVAISTAQPPSVSSSLPTYSVTTSSVVFQNSKSSGDVSNYSIW